MAVSTFEGLALGATTAAAAGFDFLSAPAGGGCSIVSAPTYRGTRAMRLVTGNVSPFPLCMAERSTSAGVNSTGTAHQRVRVLVEALPPDATGVRLLVITDSTGSFRGDVRLINTGKLQLRDAASAVLATSAATFAAGQFIDAGLATLAFSATVGQLQLALFNGSGGIAETLTSSAALNTLGAGGLCKFQVGAVRSGLSGYAVVIDDYDVSTSGTWPAFSSAPTVLNGPWSGAQTPSGFTAGYRLSGATSARLVVSASADLSSPVLGAAVAPDADGLALLPVTGLAAGSGWYFGVQADGVTLTTGRGECRTLPVAGQPASFSFWFGSCQWTQTTAQSFSAILARVGPYGRAWFGVHMGDMGYPDWPAGTTAAQVVAAHMVSLGSTAMAPLLAKVGITYQPDNHDTGGDQADRLSPAMAVVMSTMRRVFPAHTLPATNGQGGYRSWVVGRVRFVQLDTRSYRDPQANADGPGKTMLGAEQLAWLKARLLDPEPVKIICGQHPWREDGVNSGRWGSYRYEFADINSYISTNKVNVYVLTGDLHALYADNGTAPGTYGVPQAGGAPLQQGSVDPGTFWSAGAYHTAPNNLQAFGWMNVADDGAKITLQYEGVTSLDNVTRVQMVTEFTAAAPLPAVWGINF